MWVAWVLLLPPHPKLNSIEYLPLERFFFLLEWWWSREPGKPAKWSKSLSENFGWEWGSGEGLGSMWVKFEEKLGAERAVWGINWREDQFFVWHDIRQIEVNRKKYNLFDLCYIWILPLVFLKDFYEDSIYFQFYLGSRLIFLSCNYAVASFMTQ